MYTSVADYMPHKLAHTTEGDMGDMGRYDVGLSYRTMNVSATLNQKDASTTS
jgi:hypothetical protein